MPDEIENLGTILSVWAHPDDETYLAGGIMAAAVERGQRVVCVSATAGERGTDDPDTWPPERLGRLRRWETAAAMAVLGVTDHRFLDFPDGGMAEIDPDLGVGAVTAVLEEIRPATILTFGPEGGTFHPDHITISAWVTEAWKRIDRSGRLLYAVSTDEQTERFAALYEEWQIFMTDERPRGIPVADLALAVQLDEARLDQKIAALAAMASQTAAGIAMIGMDLYREMNAEECYVEA